MSIITLEEFRYAVAPIHRVEYRDPTATPNGTYTISGYAAVADQMTVLYSGAYYTAQESIARGAFANVLARNPQVHLNLNHDMTRVVASTAVPAGQAGNLMLSEDDIGLRFIATVDQEDDDARLMAVKLRNGVISQASFAFTVARDQVTTTDNADGSCTEYREILEIKDLYDVAVTPQGAYPQTSAKVARSLFTALGGIIEPDQPRERGPQEGISSSEGAETVSPDTGGGIARRKAKVARARIAHPYRGDTP